MIGLARALTPIGWAVLASVALGGLLLVGWTVGGPARSRLAEARAQASLAVGRGAAAREATETVAATAQADAATDKLTRETADAIRQAPGADQRLDPALNRAGRLGLCRRAAYRDLPECLQLAGPVDAAKAGPGR